MKSSVLVPTLFHVCCGIAITSAERQYSYPLIFSYEPQTKVVDHAAIDMDQKEIEMAVSRGGFIGLDAAKRIYTQGGHSRSYASLSLKEPLENDLESGTPLIGKNDRGVEVTGTLEKDFPAGSDIVWFLYDTHNAFGDHVDCQVGGSSLPVLDGCLSSYGVLKIDSTDEELNYYYNPETDNRNGRRFDKFSTEAIDKMYLCDDCPYVDYLKFYNYYGQYDYADEWIRSAFDGVRTDYKSGNVDFSAISSDGRAEAIKTATTFLSLWMYIIREMEVSLSHCVENCGPQNNECTPDIVHGWDQAVAFYTGALEQGSGGYLLYSLADRMCMHFGTCGYESLDRKGTAFVNFEVFKEFTEGQYNLLQGKCREARMNKERIVKLMTVPLVQGALHQAHSMHFDSNVGDEEFGQCATFAAAVLPLVSHCNKKDADTIYMHMHMEEMDFKGVKKAFERNYACMGITCEQVGGLLEVGGKYHKGCEPCVTSRGRSSGQKAGLAIGILLVIGAFAVLAASGYQSFLRSEIEFSGNATEANTNVNVNLQMVEEPEPEPVTRVNVPEAAASSKDEYDPEPMGLSAVSLT